ncbi:MAG: ABC transporter permease, partial [Bacilli bacterium]|nr:ABC transporter permease [Bacilli bacterium]
IYIIGGEENIYLNDIFYFPVSTIAAGTPYATLSAYPSLSITLKNRSIFNCFNEEYNDAVNILKTKIHDITWLKESSIVYSLADDNYSLWTLNLYADKVGVLATIFIVFFILIAILVVCSTMSRLLDEERGAMAVLKTLGYSNFAIAIRYVLFALVAGVIGIGLSAIPSKVVNSLILNAFSIQYAMKQITLPVVGPYFFILALTILVLSLALTMIKSIRTANHSPVELLTPKAPKVGKKILLERIKAIWSRLSFKYKSTYRNVFLFKARFVMTVLSIVAATVLVFASFALLNNAMKMQGFDSLQTISILLLAFSAALCALVIYNITNINISERTREIATLMVLGYRNNEVTGYIYREIYILTAIGAILGLPAGIGFIVFVFDYIGVFELSNVEWWTYLVSPILTFLFALLATRLLHMKIVKTDMNESLKVLE